MNTRALYMDFEKYTGGDEAFKVELVTLMIDNLRELYDAVAVSLMCKDYAVYRRTCHKVNSTLSMLDDRELMIVVEEVKHEPNKEKISALLQLCTDITESLRKHIRN